MHTVHAVMAVKHRDLAKSRLSAALSADQRARLVLAMFADTVEAAAAVSAIGSLTVVTPDPLVATRARELGAHALAEPPAHADPLNTALTAAANDVRRRYGAVRLLALQADLPALRPAELADFLTVAPASRALVTDHTGTGTSALLAGAAPDPLAPRFGPDSARAHREHGAVAVLGHWPGLRCDVDTPDDLDTVQALGVGTATASALWEFGITTRGGEPVRTVC
ncbi:2-phospho-L-lactate guanylyltransferase [Nocardia caishijiensis]|uniref:Phosphoenolpyruvate guanylyltransferase n=1 Tax=Nocardia caishijiensis TaxID=184756 RepID=A0ABQ6YER1_9NOCA|nr:2-phospho-L-lactate guanylyltransferase [Nocardia caishijiensis]KAF0835914.1 2-phospho-L-lactate guanylyltransferase [Nocardia caishijiensis]